MSKTQRIELRVSLLDKKLIEINAKKSGLSISQYLVDCGLHRVIKPPPSEERLSAYKELAKFHQNFTYISNLIKNNNAPEVTLEVSKVANELLIHLDEIRNGKQSEKHEGE